MKPITQVVAKPTPRPERILQFGEGNFLRAFADWMVDMANRDGTYNGSIVVCQPIAQGLGDMINKQDGLYTLAMRGLENGEAVEKIEQITSISRCINPYADYDALLSMARSEDLQVVISNTTEAGIAYHAGDALTDRPAVSFPAKVCAFLHARYTHFAGANDKGLLFLPVELIENNGAKLKRIVLQYAAEWQLDDAFIQWIEHANHFCSTLVDRIVTGYPREEAAAFEEKLGYHDDLIVTCETFNLWVIEGEQAWADILPIHKTSANVIWTNDVTPYKKRKMRILNGAHTASVPAAFLAGHDIVLEMMNDAAFVTYLDKLLQDEVIPTIDLPKAELEGFASAVKDRFRNPFIKHRLLDITLNSCSKWSARVMPTLLEAVKTSGKLPARLTFSLAALLQFYKGTMVDGVYTGTRANGDSYPIRDDAAALDFFAHAWAGNGDKPAALAAAALANTALWDGTDLTAVPGLTNAVAGHLANMAHTPMQQLVAALG